MEHSPVASEPPFQTVNNRHGKRHRSGENTPTDQTPAKRQLRTNPEMEGRRMLHTLYVKGCGYNIASKIKKASSKISR
jgi:hypothetical protein